MTQEYKQGRIDSIINYLENRLPYFLEKEKMHKRLRAYLNEFEEAKYFFSLENRIFGCDSDIELAGVIMDLLHYQI